MKTSSLFSFSCMAPFIMSYQTDKRIAFAKNFGNTFGLIFQIIDDYLDSIGDYKSLGKTPGKDIKQGKSTILQHINNDKIQNYCQKIAWNFIKKNKYFFYKWSFLEEVLFNIIFRNN